MELTTKGSQHNNKMKLWELKIMKVYYITNGNEIKDFLLGDNKNQQAEITADIHNKKNEESWLKYRVEELEVEGKLKDKGINILTTILLNNKPIRSILNKTNEIVNILDEYETYNDDYKNYTYRINYIRG
jgi:hypothetical protein